MKISAARRPGLLGFFDFRDDDYLNVEIMEMNKEMIRLSYGKEIAFSEISKIEER